MKQSLKGLVLGLAIVVLGGVAYFWWQQRQSAAPESQERSASSAWPVVATSPKPAASAAVPVPATAAIRHPIEEIQAPPSKPAVQPLPALDQSDKLLKSALSEFLDRKAMLTFLNVDDFVRRIVATADNLARGHAASRLWPVVPTPGKIQLVERPEGIFLADSNSERYTPFVRFATSVDTAKAVALYARLYPLFQQAYEDLGYPGKYFNDRLVEVIDQLLETPELTQPVKLTLTQVQGSIPSSQPWLRYEFEDPALEALPAGQKILLRMGPANALALKAKLKDFRERIVKRRSSR